MTHEINTQPSVIVLHKIACFIDLAADCKNCAGFVYAPKVHYDDDNDDDDDSLGLRRSTQPTKHMHRRHLHAVAPISVNNV